MQRNLDACCARATHRFGVVVCFDKLRCCCCGLSSTKRCWQMCRHSVHVSIFDSVDKTWRRSTKFHPRTKILCKIAYESQQAFECAGRITKHARHVLSTPTECFMGLACCSLSLFFFRFVIWLETSTATPPLSVVDKQKGGKTYSTTLGGREIVNNWRLYVRRVGVRACFRACCVNTQCITFGRGFFCSLRPNKY